MRIALIHPIFSRDHGTGRYGLDLAGALTALGHEVEIIAARARDVPPGVVVHRVPWLKGNRWLKHRSFEIMVRRHLERRNARRRPDVTLGLGRSADYDVVRLGGGCHRAQLMALRSPDSRSWPFSERKLVEMEARLVSDASPALIAVSHRVAAEMKAHYPALTKDVHVVHNGVDLRRFIPPPGGVREALRHAHNLLDGDYVVLFVGNGLYRKGLISLVRALTPHAQGGYRPGGGRRTVLLVVGRDALKSRWRDALAALARCRPALVVHVVGQVSDVVPFYWMSDVLVLPSRHEPFGNVCLEAMACGVPAVTTRCNGASEIYSPALEPLLLDHADAVDALTSTLLTLQAPEARRSMAREALRVARMHGLEENARRVLTVLEGVRTRRSRW